MIQAQSGMERKHEAWVLATLNFLNGLNIPSAHEIPIRLRLLLESINDERRRHRLELTRLRKDLRGVTADLVAINDHVELLQHRIQQVVEDHRPVEDLQADRAQLINELQNAARYQAMPLPTENPDD